MIRFNSHRVARGMTLVELLVSIGLMMFSFVGIYGLFIISVDVVTGAKARAGALALAQERIEQIRSLPYASIGTQGGIPSGNIAQSESVTLNQTTYTRRTFIDYIDDASDGTGVADTNSIAADYKKVKVEIVWYIRGSIRSYAEVTTIVPQGIESIAGGGTLRIQVINASASPVPDAAIRIVNTTGTSTVDVTTYTDSTGTVLFPGSPAGAGYQIIVTKAGYSTAQTYPSSGANPNPNPGHLSVAQTQTTTGTFAIDMLASLFLRVYRGIETKTWSDTFADSSLLSSMASTTVTGGSLTLESEETSGSASSATTSPSYLYAWRNVSYAPTTPAGSSVKVSVYFDQSGQAALVPDSALPGNAAGFSTTPISLATLSTSTYPGLLLRATLSKGSASTAPSIASWSIDYDQGPTPLPNLAFTLRGAKTIGTASGGGSVYKTAHLLSSGASSLFSTTTLEWDTYTILIDSTATGFDISGACSPLPFSVPAGSTVNGNIFVLPHTSNTLLVTVSDSATGVTINDATVTLSRTGFSSAKTTMLCGQSFYSGLSAGTIAGGNTYTVSVSKTGYQSATQTGVVVSGNSAVSVSLSPL